MKRIMTAASLAVVAQAAAGQSSATLYGFINTGLVSASSVYDQSTGRSGTVVKMDDGISWGTSRFGFTGNEDLGGGLSAIYKLEAGFDTPTGKLAGTALFNRGSWVGLNGGLGTVTLGRQWNLGDDTMVGSFFRGGYNLSVFRLTGFDEVSDLVDNAVKYKTPVLGGLQASALYGVGGVAGSPGANQVIELALAYGNGPLNLGAVYHRRNDAIAPFASELWELGANYTFGVVRLRAGYANSQYPQLDGLLRRAAVYGVGGDYTVTPALVLSADAVYRKQTGSSDSAAFVRLTTDYSLSKRTGVFTNLGLLKNRNQAAEAFYGDGLAGQSQVVLNVGVRHAF
ncbi:porin [Paraburkholderia sp. D1E]|uniref:porin n=1 Tax=Paraburkholderia sp. D1E TaxID=3461398 RepID=UPI004045838A